MVGVCVWGYRKAGGDEGKGLGSSEAGSDAGEERGSMAGHCSGVLMAARMTWQTMGTGPGQC
jgi:hypothetical protein